MARKIFIYLSLFLVAFFATLLALSPADAKENVKEFHLLELKDATIEYKSFFPGGYRQTLNGNGIDDRTLGKEVILYLNTDIGKYFFWDNRIHGGTDEVVGPDGQGTGKGQFRDVGWEFKFGVRPASFLTVLYTHHSQHVLDQKMPGRFPVEDSIGFQLHLYRDSTPRASIF